MASIALEFMKLQLPATMLADACNVEGMQKLTFEEIVARSIKLAELAYSALEEKGWIVNSPEAKELIEAEEPAGFVR